MIKSYINERCDTVCNYLPLPKFIFFHIIQNNYYMTKKPCRGQALHSCFTSDSAVISFRSALNSAQLVCII